MHLPAERSTVRVEPLALAVGRGALLDRLISLLSLQDRCTPAVINANEK